MLTVERFKACRLIGFFQAPTTQILTTIMSTVRIKLPWRNLSHMNGSNGFSATNAVHSVYPPEHTTAIIERERARTDRTGTGFSLLVISADTNRRAKAALIRVANYLSSRLRLTDELGSLDENRICVVLPTTLPTGARKVAESVRDECAEAKALEYKVYYYPSHEHFQLESESDAEPNGQPETVPAEPMEPLFAQPMRGWKRSLDIVGAIVGLVLLSPVLVLAAIAICLTSRGPILFGQLRSGCGGVPFFMYKFRSMVVDAEARKKELLAQNEQDGPAFKIRSDPRVTWVGRFLRVTSVDELPQLWNVLRGEMSLVGPRPLPCDETAKCDSWHRRRVDVTPGMTCIWQLHGRSKVSFDDWVRMDLCYIRKLSLMGDVKLLVGTVPVMVWRASGC